MGVNIVPAVIYSAMMGMTILALVDVFGRKPQRQSLYLGGLLVLLLLHILGELHIFSGAYRFSPALAGLTLPIQILLGPAFYFYAFATMSPEGNLRIKHYAFAALGPLAVLVAMIPFSMISAEDKLALANPETRDPELWKIAFATRIFSISTFILVTASYLIATFRLHNQHKTQLMERFSALGKRSMDWFRASLMLWSAVWFAYALDFMLLVVGLRWDGSGVLLPVLEATVLTVFIHFALKQPVLEAADKATPRQTTSRSYSLSKEQMDEVALKLKQAMTEGVLYLEEDLSLYRLSEAIEVSENQISETLSQRLNTNFFHFVNGFRIEEAKSLLENTNQQVTSIAFAVGFNSKSTFNAAFKKCTGQTPSAFRKFQKAQKMNDSAN